MSDASLRERLFAVLFSALLVTSLGVAGIGAFGGSAVASETEVTESTADIVVDPDGSADYETLHAALESLEEGDDGEDGDDRPTIYVVAGDHTLDPYTADARAEIHGAGMDETTIMPSAVGGWEVEEYHHIHDLTVDADGSDHALTFSNNVDVEYIRLDGGTTAPIKSLGSPTMTMDESEVVNWTDFIAVGENSGSLSAEVDAYGTDFQTDNPDDYTDGPIAITDQESRIADLEGQVTTADGTPVNDATVDAYAVDAEAILAEYDDIDSIEEAEAKAEEIREQLEDLEPDMYDMVGGPAADVDSGHDGTYVAAHGFDDWYADADLDEYALTGPGERITNAMENRYGSYSADLESQTIEFDRGQAVYLSIWDVTDEGGLLSYDGPVDRDRLGSTVNDEGEEITITRLGPGDETLDQRTVEVEHHYTDTRPVVSDVEHRAAVLEGLPPGYYAAEHDTDSPTAPVTFAVAPDAANEQMMQEMTDLEGELVEYAEWFDDLQTDGVIVHERTTTDANGHYAIDGFPDEIEEVELVAHKHPFDSLADDASLTDVRDEFATQITGSDDADIDGSVYLSAEKTVVSPPDDAADIEVQRLDNPDFMELSDLFDRLDWLSDLIDGESFTDLSAIAEQEYDRHFDDSEMGEIREGYEQLIADNPEILDYLEQFVEADDRYDSVEEMTDESYSHYVDRAISEIEMDADEQIIGEGDEPNVIEEDGTYTVEFTVPFDGSWGDTPDADEVDTLIMIETSDGERSHLTPTDDEVTITSDGIEVVHQLSEGVHISTYEVTASDGDGNIDRSEQRVEHPGLGDVPSIGSVGVSSMNPTPGETVAIDVESDDLEFRGVDEIRAYGPSGEETILSDTDDGHTFAPSEAGTHAVEIDITNSDDEVITETTRISVGDSGAAWPTSVRVDSGVTGTYAIAADNVDSATVANHGDVAELDIRVTDENTGTIHVYGQELVSESTERVEITVNDADGNALETERTVHLHTAPIPEDAHLRANGGPITDELRYGDLDHRSDGAVVYSYTAGDGTLTLDLNQHPGLLDDIRWQIDILWENISVPLLPFTVDVSIPTAGIEFAADHPVTPAPLSA